MAIPINIKDLFEQHGFVMRTAELRAARIHYADIQRLINDGQIEKVKQGYYHWIEGAEAGEAAIIKRLYPDAVICMETALFYYGYSDRTPGAWHLAVDKNIARYRVPIDYPFVKIYFHEPDVLALGLSQGDFDGMRLNIYDRDRCICDCLRYMNKMDREIFNKAIQGYVNDTKKNIPNLMRYAALLRVQRKAKELIGVWL